MRDGQADDVVRDWLVSRRTVLGAAVAAPVLVVLGGCTSSDPDDRPGPSRGGPSSGSTTPAPDPDASARARAVATSRLLIAAYESAATNAALAESLRPLLANHRAHLAALGVDPASDATRSASSSPSRSSAPAESTAASVPVGSAVPTSPPPADPAAIVASLGQIERTSSAERTSDAIAASDGSFARLLASMAACQRVHVLLLGTGPGGAESGPA